MGVAYLLFVGEDLVLRDQLMVSDVNLPASWHRLGCRGCAAAR